MRYLWLNATYLRQREGGRIVSIAAMTAVACGAEGQRDIVGLQISIAHYAGRQVVSYTGATKAQLVPV